MRLAVMMRLAVIAGTGLALFACDEQIGEREARKNVERSHRLASAGTDEANAEIRPLLEAAGSSTEATPATRANAKALLAQIELESARQVQRSLERKMMDVRRLASEINQLGNQISTANALIAGYRSYDPREPLAANEKAIADATGGPDKPAWFEHGNTQLPTLAMVRLEIARLEGEIALRREQLQSLIAQRNQTLAQAEETAKQSRGTSASSLAAFRQASDLRKKSADLATQIAALEASIRPLERDLNVARRQEAVMNNLVQELQNQAQSLQNGWQMIQQQIQAQTSLARNIVESGSTTTEAGESIAGKAAELNGVLAELSTLREQALDSARNAASHYAEAYQHADELRQDVSTLIETQPARAEQKGWRLLRDVMQPAVFRLHASAAERMLAEILASQAQEVRMRVELRNNLTPILERAGLSMPDVLEAPNVEREFEQAVSSANEAYQRADELLQRIIEGMAPPEVQNAAYVARILTLYAWSQSHASAGDESAASERLELARQVRNTAVDRNIPLPVLPARLGAPPKPAADTPEEPAASPAPDTEAPAETEDATTAPAEEDAQPEEAPTETPPENPAPPASPGRA